MFKKDHFGCFIENRGQRQNKEDWLGGFLEMQSRYDGDLGEILVYMGLGYACACVYIYVFIYTDIYMA